jgi:hypothetical protein
MITEKMGPKVDPNGDNESDLRFPFNWSVSAGVAMQILFLCMPGLAPSYCSSLIVFPSLALQTSLVHLCDTLTQRLLLPFAWLVDDTGVQFAWDASAPPQA